MSLIKVYSKVRHNYGSISEVVDFKRCPTRSYFRNVLRIKNYSPKVENDRDYHRLFCQTSVCDRGVASEFLSKNMGELREKDVDLDIFLKHYSVVPAKAYPLEKAINGEEVANFRAKARRNRFAEKKAEFEAEQMRELIKGSSSPRKAITEFYIESKIPSLDDDSFLVSGELHLIGLPDKIVKIDGRWVPYEFKVKEDPIDVLDQLQGQVLLVDTDNLFGDCDLSLLYIFEDGVLGGYKPSSAELEGFKGTLEELLEFKKSIMTSKKGIRYQPPNCFSDQCSECEFSARCDPNEVDAIVNLGEWIVGRHPISKRYNEPGERKTVGIEALVSLEAIQKGNTVYETARMFGEFPSLLEFCHENNISSFDEGLRFSEMFANSFTVDRLVLLMEYGFKPTQRKSVGGVARQMNISDTSVGLILDIAYELKWMHKPEKISNPFAPGPPITWYRRKKLGEMDDDARELFVKTRSDVMRKLRKCGVPLTTVFKEMSKGMERKAKLDEEYQYIRATDSDAGKSGGTRRFKSFKRKDDEPMTYTLRLIDSIVERPHIAAGVKRLFQTP
jgi:hypothetical protein